MSFASDAWEIRLREAGWLPGDRYNPADPTRSIRTRNVRLKLMNSGLWSRRLVDGIIMKRANGPSRPKSPNPQATGR